MTDLRDRISAMLGDPARDLDRIEVTLTDGYAHALALEAENWRLEKRMASLSQGIQSGDTAEKARELAAIAKLHELNDDELAKLRGLLSELRRHADDVRVGPPSL